MHKTIKKVGDDLNTFQFNTAVASLMTWLNFLSPKKNRKRRIHDFFKAIGSIRAVYNRRALAIK